VPDGVGNLAMLDKPLRGPPVQPRHLCGQRPAQLQPQQIPEQVVVAKPRAPGVQRHDKRVRVFQCQQDPFRARAAGQQIRQLTVDPAEQGSTQQDANRRRPRPLGIRPAHEVSTARALKAAAVTARLIDG
jgi:hypothetical protein